MSAAPTAVNVRRRIQSTVIVSTGTASSASRAEVAENIANVGMVCASRALTEMGPSVRVTVVEGGSAGSESRCSLATGYNKPD